MLSTNKKIKVSVEPRLETQAPPSEFSSHSTMLGKDEVISGNGTPSRGTIGNKSLFSLLTLANSSKGKLGTRRKAERLCPGIDKL